MTKDVNTSNDWFSRFQEDELDLDQQAFVQGGKKPTKRVGFPDEDEDETNDKAPKIGKTIPKLEDENKETRKDLLRCAIETSKGRSW